MSVIDEMFSDENPLCDLHEAIEKKASGAEHPEKEGFSQIWSQVLSTTVDHGLEAGARRVEKMKKNAGSGPFHEGMSKCASMVNKIRDLPEARGWYGFIKDAYDKSNSQEDLMKFAEDVTGRVDDPNRHEDGYRAAAQALKDRRDLVDVAWNGPLIMTSG